MPQKAMLVRRGPVDEEEDFESVVQKMLAQDFDTWPNEAGVRMKTIHNFMSSC